MSTHSQLYDEWFNIATAELLKKDNELRSNKTNHKECYFYHISDSHTEQTITFKPRKPSSSEGYICSIERICVAPTVEQCLSALCSFENGTWSVYRTKNKFKCSIKPYRVNDSVISQERWFFESTDFIKVGEIEANVPDDFSPTTISTKSGSSTFYLDTERRGGIDNFQFQFNEFIDLKAFVESEEKFIFYSDSYLEEHKSQRNMNLKFNRIKPRA